MEKPTFSAEISRTTGETDVSLKLNLHGTGHVDLDVPIPFLKHMLHLFAAHGNFDLTIRSTGDIDVDDHHLAEDIGLCLGRAISQALGNKAGIQRYGERHTPMDETLARCVLDLSGRPAFVLHAAFKSERIGTFPTELVAEFFKSVANEARMAVHLAVLYGENTHHMVEGLFKAFGAALSEAAARRGTELRSTKGVLE